MYFIYSTCLLSLQSLELRIGAQSGLYVPSGICEASAILASILVTISSCCLVRNVPELVRMVLGTLFPEALSTTVDLAMVGSA
jgi:hypothetical protein